jgi:hypothetical protein
MGSMMETEPRHQWGPESMATQIEKAIAKSGRSDVHPREVDSIMLGLLCALTQAGNA